MAGVEDWACSYSPLFIPRCQSFNGNQLVNFSRVPSFPFLAILSPQSSLLSLSLVQRRFTNYWKKTKLTQATNQSVGIGSRRPDEAGCEDFEEEVSTALLAESPVCCPALQIPALPFQLTTGPAWMGRTFKKPC